MSRRLGLAAIFAGGMMVIAACTHSGDAQSAGSGQRRATGTATVTAQPRPGSPTGSASPAPAPSPTRTPPEARRKLKPGARNADVRALQHRLRELHYDPGKIDGRYGPTTQMAVWAFQKINRIKPSGTVGTRVWRALDAPRTPKPVAKKREDDRVDIDLERQYLVVYKDGAPALISHISSGGGYRYCAKDPGSQTPRCRYAVTSTGDFRTGRRVSGWDDGPLGALYNPVYFNGGIAVHGYPSVPLSPVSHGCVRIPMHAADLFPKLVGTNVPVHVRR
ncbi:MAG TPA: L,D-transpeptidase family protein [Streptosporangiaceae bacterium]|jgi:peptidoglycan hydrolase-like protein with peptidoglycan-binding domain|nr:L,D-transpeptidase family protein [Streptosporangiaceae bacterium]